MSVTGSAVGGLVQYQELLDKVSACVAIATGSRRPEKRCFCLAPLGPVTMNQPDSSLCDGPSCRGGFCWIDRGSEPFFAALSTICWRSVDFYKLQVWEVCIGNRAERATNPCNRCDRWHRRGNGPDACRRGRKRHCFWAKRGKAT